ncbi:MAG: response regulator [Candidatus Rokubacteria bacterium]|nr:response regulator [Candidatus Rokubacteria bacterium]
MPSPRPEPRKWVLVVEDDYDLRHLWLEALQGSGYATLAAADGAEALWVLRHLYPHLIVLDLQMPRVSGWEVLETIRRHSVLRTVPILIVSGHLDEPGRQDVERGVNVVSILEKPVSVERFLTTVREGLRIEGPTR